MRWAGLAARVSKRRNVRRILMGKPEVKVKVKVKAVCGSYSTAALRHIVLLPE